jgi:hypothetical protein
LLCSYSPASCINSFLDETGIVSLKPARHYVDYVCRLSARLAADFYLPFASQAVFERRDSCWANDYRTTYDDLLQYWQSETRLLPPYTTIDLTDFTTDSIPPEQYRPMERSRLAELTARRVAEEETTALAADDVAGLERKLNVFRWFLWLFFPRGFAFQLGERRLLQRAPRPPGGSQQIEVRRLYHRNTKIGGEGSCSEQPCLGTRHLDVRAGPPAEAGGSAKSICAIRGAPARRLRAPQEPGGVAAVDGTRSVAYIRASTAGSAASESDRSRSRRGQPWCAPDSRRTALCKNSTAAATCGSLPVPMITGLIGCSASALLRAEAAGPRLGLELSVPPFFSAP